MINKIKDIVKIELTYQNNIFKDDNENNSVFVNASDQIEVDDEENVATVFLIFTMKNVDKKEEELYENGEKELHEVLKKENTIGELTVKYRVDFEDNENDTKELREEILEIIEPYFRKEVETLLSNMKLPNFLLPFRFWKNEN